MEDLRILKSDFPNTEQKSRDNNIYILAMKWVFKTLRQNLATVYYLLLYSNKNKMKTVKYKKYK